MAKDRKQAKIAKGAIRQTGRRNGNPAFLKENLNRPAFNLNVEVLNAVVQFPERLQNAPFDSRVTT